MLRTYLSVFHDVAVWYGTGPDLLLLGFAGPATGLDLDRFEQRASRPDIAAGLRRSGVDDLPELLAHELLPAGVLAAIGLEGPVHTLLHPRLSYAAGRAFFEGGIGGLPFSGFGEPARVGARNSLLRRYLARFPGGAPDDVYAALAREACFFRVDRCSVVLAEWSLHHPASAALSRALAKKKNELFGGPLPEGVVAQVAAVLAGAPQPDGESTLAQLRQATQAYLLYYDHGIAFDAAGLLDGWDHCTGDQAQCERGRTAVRELIETGGRHPTATAAEAP